MDNISPQSTVHSPQLSSFAERPDWLKVRLETSSSFYRIRSLNKRLNLNTVCEQAACPNIGTCWAKHDVTYILLGKECTRSCSFCNVSRNKPKGIDPDEPQSIALAVKELGLEFVVLTSVTRDDLADMGLSQFLATVSCIKKISPGTKIELLIPDFKAAFKLLEKIANCGCEVIGHNIETVSALYPVLRPNIEYATPLNVLKTLRDSNSSLITKSAILLGLGEGEAELIDTIKDLKAASVDILYLGQYLSPSKKHWPVEKFYSPDEFRYFKDIALELGFKAVVSEPLARSSWKARSVYELATSVNIKNDIRSHT